MQLNNDLLQQKNIFFIYCQVDHNAEFWAHSMHPDPVSIDLCKVRRDGAPDFRRFYVPIFGKHIEILVWLNPFLFS